MRQIKATICILLSTLILVLSACGGLVPPLPTEPTPDANREPSPSTDDAVSVDPTDLEIESVSMPTISDYIPLDSTEASTEQTTEASTEPSESEAPSTDYANFSGNYSVGDKISFELFYIEPTYTVDSNSGSVQIVIGSDRDTNFLCKCYTNEAHTEFLYMYITGDDYCDNFSKTEFVDSLSFYLPPIVVAEAVYSDSLAEDFSATSGTLISFNFLEVSGKADYNEEKAVALSDKHTDGEKVFIRDIYSVEPISFTYHSKYMSMAYELDYIICECTTVDNVKYQIAIELDDYNTFINPEANLTFDGNMVTLGINGDTSRAFFDDRVTIYGFARQTGMFIDGASEYPYTILFHHTSN